MDACGRTGHVLRVKGKGAFDLRAFCGFGPQSSPIIQQGGLVCTVLVKEVVASVSEWGRAGLFTDVQTCTFGAPGALGPLLQPSRFLKVNLYILVPP